MTDKSLMRALGFTVLVIVALCICWHVASCSPVNVQVQNCQNEVRDAKGVTFTGCKADGDPDADGTLRVNVNRPDGAPEESRRLTPCERRRLASAPLN